MDHLDDLDEMPESIAEGVSQKVQELHRGQDHGEDLLVGWVMICEWMSPDGERTLSRHAPAGVSSWQARGYLQTGADFQEWPWYRDSDDDDDPDS